VKRRPGFVGALVLIALGGVLMLHNAGVINFSVADLLKYWPVLLILFGIEVLVSRSESAVTYVLGLFWAVVAIVATFALAWWSSTLEPSEQAALPRDPITVPLDGASSATVNLRLGYGDVTLGKITDPANLVDGATVGRGAALTQDRVVTNGVATLNLTSNQPRPGPIQFLEEFPSRVRWELGLSDRVPLTLAVAFGSGKARLDLSDLNVTRLDLGLSAGELSLVLPKAGKLDAEVDASVGKVVIEVPEGVRARIGFAPGLKTLTASPRFESWGDRYQTAGFDDSGDFHDVFVTVGLAQVELR
jgi:hypothetical protein